MSKRATQTIRLTLSVLILWVLSAPASAKTIYVDANAAGGANDGSSWANAYVYLQEALAAARLADKPLEVRVAQGIYRPDQGLVAIPEFDWRTTTFELINGVTLQGGYAGLGASDPNARDAELYETILSGDLNSNDGLNFAGYSENSYHVVTGSGTDNTAVLDGFVVTGGNADRGSFPDPRSLGGGFYNVAGSPRLSHCTFRNNRAFSGGGGMYNAEGSDPVLENCRFIGNFTDEDGAGMLNYGQSNPVLTNCDFVENVADDHGGGMLNAYRCNPVLHDCMFIANSAGLESRSHDGGGMYNDDASPTVTHCLFIRNTAGRNGGGMHNRGQSRPTLQNCTFSENRAGSDGGGIHSQNAAAILVNCIVWANGPDAIYGNANVAYSDVAGGFVGEGNINADPLFADPANGDYHLKSQAGRWDPVSGSWVKDDVTSPCIDAGDPNSDWSGETWPHGRRINMGAYGGTREASMSAPPMSSGKQSVRTKRKNCWTNTAQMADSGLLPFAGHWW